MGHRNTSCDHIYIKPSSNQRSTTSREASAAGRLRPNAVTVAWLSSDFRLRELNQELASRCEWRGLHPSRTRRNPMGGSSLRRAAEQEQLFQQRNTFESYAGWRWSESEIFEKPNICVPSLLAVG